MTATVSRRNIAREVLNLPRVRPNPSSTVAGFGRPRLFLMGAQIMATSLRRKIESHEYLSIIDDASAGNDFAVIDHRDRRNLGVTVTSEADLIALISMGADKYLESPHNFKSAKGGAV